MNNDLNKVIVVDLEMSGLDPTQNGILSIGAVLLSYKGEEPSTFFNNPDGSTGKLRSVVSPESFYTELCLEESQDCDLKALAVNGFTLTEAYDNSKLTQKEGVKLFYDWVEVLRKGWGGETAIIAGHNIHCDISFLRSVKNSWPFRYRVLDTHSLALGKTGISMSSPHMVEYLKVKGEPDIHNALEGAKMAKRCLVELIKPYSF